VTELLQSLGALNAVVLSLIAFIAHDYKRRLNKIEALLGEQRTQIAELKAKIEMILND
jgi:hypothetical protein